MIIINPYNVIPSTPPVSYMSSGLLVDLKGYWNFEEIDGPFVDATGTQNITSYQSYTPNQVGKVNKSVLLTNLNAPYSYLSTPYNANQNLKGKTEITLSFWLKIISFPASIFTSVIFCGSAYAVMISPTGYVFFSIKNQSFSLNVNSYTNPNTITLNTWYNLICSWKFPEILRIYVNNVDKTSSFSGVFNDSIRTEVAPTYFAGIANSSGFSGYIDEIGIWHRSLSAAERTQLYNNGNGLTYPI